MAHKPEQEKPPQWEAHAPQLKPSCSNVRSRAAKNKQTNKQKKEMSWWCLCHENWDHESNWKAWESKEKFLLTWFSDEKKKKSIQMYAKAHWKVNYNLDFTDQ